MASPMTACSPDERGTVESFMKEDLEEKFSRFSQDLVSTWNPCNTKDGNIRFDWNAQVEARDVELDAGGVSSLQVEGDELHRWPKRVRLSQVLEETFWDFDEHKEKWKERDVIDVQPLRCLVAMLVETSATHQAHGMDTPVMGKHACARCHKGKVTCRYGFPIKELRPRLGGCDCALVKGDREGQWHLCNPHNNQLCCTYEDHVLLANLWAVVQYISKYATKAPKGSRHLEQVLSDAVDDVCRYLPKEHDLVRRSIQRFFARPLGEQTEAVGTDKLHVFRSLKRQRIV